VDAKQKREVRDELSDVKHKLRSWDPIGVVVDPNDPDHSLDEYDSYAPQVLGLLWRGADVEALAQHLDNVAQSQMGLNLPIEFHRKFAEHLVAWWRTRQAAQTI